MDNIKKLSALIRYFILTSTTAAGSGHPSSSLSATDLMAALIFSAQGGSALGGGGFFHFDVKHPEFPNNDRLIFSKGHAAPLLYALWAAAGAISKKELLTLRRFGSRLEGHPTIAFPYAEAATGSLGQGLSIGVGMALNAKYLDKLPYRTFVLIGDSEMSEGSVWEACALASHYKLDNLVAIVDVNRLGQRGETMHGHHIEIYKKKMEAFGWETIVVDGHDHVAIAAAYKKALQTKEKPVVIIAKTLKGKGVSIMENKDGWHGKTLKPNELDQALAELGKIDIKMRGNISKPLPKNNHQSLITNHQSLSPHTYKKGEMIATRKAYGEALAEIGATRSDVVVLDAETSNSTYAELFKKEYPERFFEMFIAEQNMVGTALGLSRRGKKPFVSTFAAFFSRAFDQIRMSRYSDANMVFSGSHAGVSIGEDGPSQMGLEDIALFRTLLESVVLYPSDAVSTIAAVTLAAEHHGISYVRTTRKETAILYSEKEIFKIGGSKVLKKSKNDVATVVGAGVTLHEALKAHELLQKESIAIRVIDLYSVKPLDFTTLKKAARETKAIITVEDHYAEGGIGEAVASALSQKKIPVISLAVRKMPRSGKPEELLEYEGIDAMAIVRAVKKIRRA